MQKTFTINPRLLELENIKEIFQNKYQLSLSDDSINRIEKCRSFLEKKLQESDALYYGINTGFGALHNIEISKEQVRQLQHNLVQSHACGLGEEVPLDIIKILSLLKIQSLCQGFSGVRLKLVKHIINLYNLDIFPVIYQQGSLGASGDLAPLAHFSLPLIGLGEVYLQGERLSTKEGYKKLSLLPLHLEAKEGLALLNGTQFSTAFGVWCTLESERLLSIATLCAALSLDAYYCHLSPFDKRLHQIRPHQGQKEEATAIREWLADSEISKHPKEHVQDPYAFRCIPQVHGASRDALAYIKSVVQTEINSVTDNPNLFPDSDAILSGGNFHGQPIALALDYLAIALAEIGSISERRTYQLLSGSRGLPQFLIQEAGLHSGMMIPQYTAASIVSQNKQLCTPASVDSIVSSNGQEDHVSMSANAGTKAYKVVQNVERVLAIEFMTAAQALEFRRPAKTSTVLETILSNYRRVVPILREDRVLNLDVEKTITFLKTVELPEKFG